jgi:hypothetical protein
LIVGDETAVKDWTGGLSGYGYEEEESGDEIDEHGFKEY